MKPNKRMIAFFCFCLVVGFAGVLTARGTEGLPMYVSPKTVSDYKTNIETEKKDLERVKHLKEDAQAKLSEYEALLSGNDVELQTKIKSDLEYYKILSGRTAVHGSGVEVVVDDGTRDLYKGENVNDILVHDQDILVILNDLKRSGAEAISVNGQRIIDTSAISCAGYTIRINGQTYARPFEIKAVGDANRMASALVAPEGYATILKVWGVTCKVTIKDDIVIPAYAEDPTYQYAEKMTEKEKEGE